MDTTQILFCCLLTSGTGAGTNFGKVSKKCNLLESVKFTEEIWVYLCCSLMCEALPLLFDA